MAYKQDTKHKCIRGCGKDGRYRVFNTYNSPMGHYCAKHADVRVAELNRQERAKEND